VQNKEPSYLWEMLRSQPNLYALLGSVAAGVVLSIPFGFGVGAIPLIAFAAGEAIAAMYVPALPTFRARVDKEYREKAREATRWHLIDEIQSRMRTRGSSRGSLDAYNRMVERVSSLFKVAEESQTQLAAYDVERLDDSTLDYLSIWLATLVIDDRSNAVNLRDIEQRIDAIEREIRDAKPGADLKQLQIARNDYAGLLTRHRRMQSRRRALEAALVSMPDQMEEIYQTIMMAPTCTEVGSKLEEAIAKLRLQEDIEAELASDLRETVPDFSARLQQRQTRQTQAMGRRAVQEQRI